MSSRLAAHALSIDLPPGWEGRIYRRHGGDPILHAANFPLPASDGDFGSGATARMPPGGCFIALTEYRPGQGLEPGRGLFASSTLPLPLSAHDFHARALQVGRAGQAGMQHFFTAGGRPFCLYAVVRRAASPGHATAAGEHQLRAMNGILGTVRFD